MDEGLILLRLQGRDVRNGRVTTGAFTTLIRRFAATVAIFERAFNGRTRRSVELTIATLRRENPFVVGMHPEARSAAFPAEPALLWTFEEIERIGRGMAPDDRLPLEALDNLVALSDDEDDEERQGLAAFDASFRGKEVRFDAVMARAAKTQRHAAVARLPAPLWFAGMSRGSLLGELRGVTDLAGEREFYIRLPAGKRAVKCVFAEGLRTRMNELLFQPVRVSGFLHYDGSSPHANLVEATNIEPLNEAERPHLLDHKGLFAGSYFPPVPELPQ